MSHRTNPPEIERERWRAEYRARDAERIRHTKRHDTLTDSAHEWTPDGRMRDVGGRLEQRHVCACGARKTISESYLGGASHPTIATITLASGRASKRAELKP